RFPAARLQKHLLPELEEERLMEACFEKGGIGDARVAQYCWKESFCLPLDCADPPEARVVPLLGCHQSLAGFQPVGLVEKIQAIAQNVSDIAIRMEQILKKKSMPVIGQDGIMGQCDIPKHPNYPECASKVDIWNIVKVALALLQIDTLCILNYLDNRLVIASSQDWDRVFKYLSWSWMRARWTSDPCYAFYGVDGSDCSFLVYLSEVEWFCPPMARRNQSSQPIASSQQKGQAFFRWDLSLLLERVGSAKESLSFMSRRIRRLSAQWTSAAKQLNERLNGRHREQRK
ncbi:hypothetical protein DNTS_015568, partial [Danionella cerebrum]